MAKTDVLEKKSERFLHKEFHDLLVIKKVIERYMQMKDQKPAEKYIKVIEAKIKKEEHLENKLDHFLSKLENSLSELQRDNPSLYQKLLPLFRQIDVYKKNLLVELGKHGNLEKIAKSEDMQRLYSEIERTIKLDQALKLDIQNLEKEIMGEFGGASQPQKPKGPVLELKDADDAVKRYALQVISSSWRRKLSSQEVDRIIQDGIGFRFRGSPYNAKELNYALFFHKINREFPVRIDVKCVFSTSSHKGLIGNNFTELITAGILGDGRFKGYSPTWYSETPNGSPAYIFGEKVNELMLKTFGIPK